LITHAYFLGTMNEGRAWEVKRHWFLKSFLDQDQCHKENMSIGRLYSSRLICLV